MIRVKICGIRHPEDAVAAAEAGASALGFNFWKGTARYILPREAARMIALVPEGLWRVGVFVDERPERVHEIAAETGVSVLQFHGSETPDYWDRFVAFKRIKAVKLAGRFPAAEVARFASPDALLLDASVKGLVGGTGQTFDWSLAEPAKAYGRVILAGGLNVDNVAEAVRRVRPWGVDVCSGVESEPGRKDPELIRKFIETVRAVEKEIESGSGAE